MNQGEIANESKRFIFTRGVYKKINVACSFLKESLMLSLLRKK